MLEVHGERLLKENFKPGFPARLYRKDLRIVMDALNEAQAPAPVTAHRAAAADRAHRGRETRRSTTQRSATVTRASERWLAYSKARSTAAMSAGGGGGDVDALPVDG